MKLEFNCTQCNKLVTKIRQPNQDRYFCSRSCWSTYSNLHDTHKYIRSEKTGQNKICKLCNKEVVGRSKKATRCLECINRLESGDIPLSEIIYTEHHKSSAYALVRTRARAIASKLGWKSCVKCGYDKHIQIAHKRQVASFSDDTLLSVVNHPDNLIPLCPNCHWEYDHPVKEKKVKVSKLVDSAKSRKCLQSVPSEKKICPDCNKHKHYNHERCRQCSAKERAKNNPNRPPKEQLEADFLELKSFLKVGKKYNVSDNAIRKWCKYYNLPHLRYQK